MNDRCPTCLRPYRKTRSINQNDYFHGVVCKIIGDSLGYDIKEMKGIIKWQIREQYGWDVKHTSELTTVEFEKFCTYVREWAGRNDNGKDSIYVPEPNEYIETETLYLKGQNKQRPVPINRLDQ